jgi:iron complex transport system substrate-binding protein
MKALWLALIALPLAAAPVQASEIIDDRGVPVRLARAPERIVSLFPSLTETVCQLGHCDRLVGVDRYSNFPARVRSLPQVGGGLDPSIEAIVALKPDLVLMATSSRGAAQLTALGIPVAALQPRNHADVQQMLERVGRLLEVPPELTQRLWRDVEAGLAAAVQAVPQSLRGTRVYVEVNAGPYAASEASFIGETLARLGLRNVVPAALGPYPKLNPEFVVRADPDLIIVGDSNAAAMAARPGWSRLAALRAQRVCAFAPAQSDVLVRAGPRLAEGAQLIVQCLQDKAGAGGGRP